MNVCRVFEVNVEITIVEMIFEKNTNCNGLQFALNQLWMKCVRMEFGDSSKCFQKWI